MPRIGNIKIKNDNRGARNSWWHGRLARAFRSTDATPCRYAIHQKANPRTRGKFRAPKQRPGSRQQSGSAVSNCVGQGYGKVVLTIVVVSAASIKATEFRSRILSGNVTEVTVRLPLASVVTVWCVEPLNTRS